MNPTQFGPNEDFARYPRTLEADLALLESAGCDLVLVPTAEETYPPNFSTYIQPPSVALPLEGAFRPDHFRGVCTVVLKLLHLVPSDAAFFGQKDYQQALVIRHMARDLNVATTIHVCPIVREPDGLALSSRNRYLSEEERSRSQALSLALQKGRTMYDSGERAAKSISAAIREVLQSHGITRIDYATVVDAETLGEVESLDRLCVALIACHVGQTRLIDNCLLSESTA